MSMTVQQIESKIQEEYAAFQKSLYFGKLPEGMIEAFKKAIMEIAPNNHKILVPTLRKIVLKKEKELTIVEVGIAVNAILAAPLYAISDDLIDALNQLEKYEGIVKDYNSAVNKKNEELYQRKMNLMKLAGLDHSGKGQVKHILQN